MSEGKVEFTGEDATILGACSDPRVTILISDEEFRKQLGLGKSYSSVTATGGIKFFLNQGRMSLFFEQLSILNHFKPAKVIILSHLGCGYYKNLGFTDLGEMREEMIRDFRQATTEIKEKFPNFQIEGYILNHDTAALEAITQ